MTRSNVDRAREILRAAGRVVVLTGAGVSAESGVPTFRGPDGLWKSFRPEELATPEAFSRDPRLVWEWYAWRRELVEACAPNPAHGAMARAALDRSGSLMIVTQNVDGLHHRAARSAVESSNVDPEVAFPLEVHGAIHRDRCSSCSHRDPTPGPVDSTSVDTLPRCPSCGGVMRPDVVWFGEALDARVIGAAFDAAEEADVCLVVGTSALVHPAASIPSATLSAGGTIIEVNLESTPLTPHAAVSLREPAGEVRPDLFAV